jgi:hypothetical protein
VRSSTTHANLSALQISLTTNWRAMARAAFDARALGDAAADVRM